MATMKKILETKTFNFVNFIIPLTIHFIAYFYFIFRWKIDEILRDMYKLKSQKNLFLLLNLISFIQLIVINLI